MIRLHFVVEGQTEEEFVNAVLAEHLGRLAISVDSRRVETSRRRARYYGGQTTPAKIFRGGLSSYSKAKKDLQLWMKEDQNSDARFTTMFDLYALPGDFPAYDQARGVTDPYRRVEILEGAIAADIADSRLIPYIQLHEFEALVLAEPLQLASEFPGQESSVRNLDALVQRYQSPEFIDDGEQSAPSKRIINEIERGAVMATAEQVKPSDNSGVECKRGTIDNRLLAGETRSTAKTSAASPSNRAHTRCSSRKANSSTSTTSSAAWAARRRPRTTDAAHARQT